MSFNMTAIPGYSSILGFGPDAAFDGIYSLITGHSSLSWRYVQGKTPLSTNNSVYAAIGAYLIIIYAGRYLMRNREPFQFNTLFQIHNLLLTTVSASLLVLMLEQIVPMVYKHGFFYAICSEGAWTQRLVLFYYLNYITKYYELIDTLFLVLRKKPLIFLHVYHHPATAILCYTQLNGQTSVSWVPIVLNLSVHVLMYYYYYLSSRGVRVWWKQWVTTSQIIQFVLDLAVIYFACYTYFVSEYWPQLPHMGSCTGTESSAVFGAALLSSYLVLFIGFYKTTYKTQKKKGATLTVQNGTATNGKAANGKANGHAKKTQ